MERGVDRFRENFLDRDKRPIAGYREIKPAGQISRIRTKNEKSVWVIASEAKQARI